MHQIESFKEKFKVMVISHSTRRFIKNLEKNSKDFLNFVIMYKKKHWKSFKKNLSYSNYS